MGRCQQEADKTTFRLVGFVGAILRQTQASFTFLQNASRKKRDFRFGGGQFVPGRRARSEGKR
jgi:hypothetical protein